MALGSLQQIRSELTNRGIEANGTLKELREKLNRILTEEKAGQLIQQQTHSSFEPIEKTNNVPEVPQGSESIPKSEDLVSPKSKPKTTKFGVGGDLFNSRFKAFKSEVQDSVLTVTDSIPLNPTKETTIQNTRAPDAIKQVVDMAPRQSTAPLISEPIPKSIQLPITPPLPTPLQTKASPTELPFRNHLGVSGDSSAATRVVSEPPQTTMRVPPIPKPDITASIPVIDLPVSNNVHYDTLSKPKPEPNVWPSAPEVTPPKAKQEDVFQDSYFRSTDQKSTRHVADSQHQKSVPKSSKPITLETSRLHQPPNPKVSTPVNLENSAIHSPPKSKPSEPINPILGRPLTNFENLILDQFKLVGRFISVASKEGFIKTITKSEFRVLLWVGIFFLFFLASK